jgi:penicillin-binding protein 2
VLPSTDWKRRTYKRPEQRRWYAGETISLGIGQGYNNFTMLQIASAMSTLAAGGQRFEPRLVREVEDLVTRERRHVESKPLEPLPLRPEHVNVVLQAMHGVTTNGTSAKVFAGAHYLSGGKTGTAQAVGIRQNEKYSAARVAEHLRDHSLYVAFAPLEQPRIALAVIVENAGWGAAAAAPIARRVFDYVLTGQYPSVDDIAATQKGQSVAPIGTARPIDSVPLPVVSSSSVAMGPLAGVTVGTAASAAPGSAAPASAASAAAVPPPPATTPTAASAAPLVARSASGAPR